MCICICAGEGGRQREKERKIDRGDRVCSKRVARPRMSVYVCLYKKMKTEDGRRVREIKKERERERQAHKSTGKKDVSKKELHILHAVAIKETKK